MAFSFIKLMYSSDTLTKREAVILKICPPAIITSAEVISNSNWSEWSTIQGVIGRVISKSAEREARGRFEITSTITT